MANATVSRVGAINGVVTTEADIRAMFEEIYSGEVTTMYEQTTVAKDKVMVRTIDHGKSANFPIIGAVGADYHTPGTEITGRVIKGAERTISIDGVLLSDVAVAEIDELMNHYDVRAPYAKEQGRKLAYQLDQDLFCTLIAASRASNVHDDYPDGQVIADANLGSATLATAADALGNALYLAAQKMDENDVPEDSRFAAFRPAEYYKLVKAVQSTGFSAIAKEFGGLGSYAEGNIVKVAGIQILKSNRVPITDLSATLPHGINASTTKGIVWHPDAIGLLQLMGVKTEFGWDMRRQVTLLIAKMAVGMGVLRPECAFELRTGNPT